MNCYGFGHQFEKDNYPDFDAPFDFSHVSVILERKQTNDVWKKKTPIKKRLLELLCILSFAVFLMTAASCGSGADYRPTQSPAIETAAPTDMYEMSVSVEEQVLLKEQGVKITALSIYDTCESPRLRIQIENNGKNEITVTLWQAQINGKAIEFNDMNCVVEAGKEETAAIKLSTPFLISIRDIELGFRIHDNVAMTDTDYDITTIKTISAESATQADETDDSTTLGENGVIYNAGGVKIYVGSYQAPSSYVDSPAFEVGIANDSDYEVDAFFRNFVINGQTVESALLNFNNSSAGNAWHEFMSFDADELAYLGITTLETVDFQLRVRTFDGISDKVQIYNVSMSIPESTGNNFNFVYPEVTAVFEDVEAEANVFIGQVEEHFLGDQNGIKTTVLPASITDINLSHWSTKFNFLLENNTGADLHCSLTYASINGVMVSAALIFPNYDPNIHSGEQLSCSISISNDSMIAAGIQAIKDIEFSINFQSLYKEYQLYTAFSTDAPDSFVQVLDDSGTVILNQGGVKVVVQGFYTDLLLDYSYVKFYIKNSSDRAVCFDLQDVTINGEGKPRIFIDTIYPGKVAYDEIEFTAGELDYNDLFEFRLEMCDADTDAVLFKTDVVSLTFPK